MCVCCQELAFQPITTICSHNVCKVRPPASTAPLAPPPRRSRTGANLLSPPPPSSPQTCLQRSFRAKVYTCPACRHDLGKDYIMTQNTTLQKLLDQFFPGYSKGR